MQVVDRSIDDLKPYAQNARTHSKRQIRQIANSICEFGFTNPVVIDAEDTILAGHGRVEAAKLLGMESVPTIRLDHMTPAQKRAYRLADNKIAENAGWDPEILEIEFQYLTEIDIDFAVTVTGFEMAEIDLTLENAAQADPDDADDIPEIDDAKPPITRIGDHLCLGPHHVFCGDARDAGCYEQLLDGESAQTIFADPPYNVSIRNNVTGRGRIKHREFVMASGEMPPTTYRDFLSCVLRNLVHFSLDGSIHYICIDWRGIQTLLEAAMTCYRELKNVAVWDKGNGGMGSLYRSQHELILVLKNGTAAHINNVELGRYGRNRTNLWRYPGLNTFRDGRLDELALHPTVKPVALVADAILDCSHRNGIVLDPFVGSGTTIIAAEKTARRCYGIELDPVYVDTAVRRWQAFTGETAIHAETGLTFDEMEHRRCDDSTPADAEVCDV